MAVYPERRKGRLSGKWIAEVTRNGERVARKTFDLKKDADRWHDSFKLGFAIEPEPVEVGPTVKEVAREARENNPKWSSGRDRSRFQRLDYVVEALGADRPIAEIKTADLDALVRKLKGTPSPRGKRAGATINRYLTLASALFTFAKKRLYITHAPDVPWQQENCAEMNWVRENREADIISYLDKRDPACAVTARALIATGLRWSEFAGLEPDQIDGKWIRLWKTKTDKPRSVPVEDSELLEAIKTLLVEKRIPKYSTFHDRLQEAFKSAGQNPSRPVHALRHTTGTRLIQRGVNLRIAQKYLGHSSIKTTTRYAHVADEDLEMASQKLSPRAGQINSEEAKMEVFARKANRSEIIVPLEENEDDKAKVLGLNSRLTDWISRSPGPQPLTR